LDLILARNPKLAIVDELAHTNVMGSRHSKRYNDVQELLQAGIDVYTTLNVQHLESLQDIVASITRIYVNERIPDKIFDQADQVILVDIEPIELIKRLNEGKIYKKAQINRALNNFFITNNLVALREIALRRVADRVNKTADVATKGFTKEHIMICLSKSPTNASVIRTASR
ncbi:MAG: sensor histidine kinase KdpD, partial [Longicatena sp.]